MISDIIKMLTVAVPIIVAVILASLVMDYIKVSEKLKTIAWIVIAILAASYVLKSCNLA